MNKEKIIVALVVGIVLAVGEMCVLAVGLAWERGHNAGYNEGWNDGRADGTEQGWQECIEENNLYSRYGTIRLEQIDE